MSQWPSLAEKVFELVPELEDVLEKSWFFDEAKKAHHGSTHPNGATPLVAMLLMLAESNKVDEIKKCSQILTNEKAKKSKRLKELKGKDAYNSGTAWQAMSELAILNKISQSNDDLKYDETGADRTPDFIIQLDKLTIGIEHTAPDEGSYMKRMRESVENDLKRAHDVTKILNVLKKLQDEGHPDVVNTLTTSELEDITQSLTGTRKENGKSFTMISKEDLEREINGHKIEECSVFSGQPYALNRNPDAIENIRYIRSLKVDGEQVKGCDFKILALSLPGHLYQRSDLKKINRLEYPNSPDLVRLHSGVVWNGILGKENDVIYLGILEEHLIKRGWTYGTKTCDADGILVGDTSPYQAVIISIFPSHLHYMGTPNALTGGGLVVPHNLNPYCYLFLRTDKNVLPQNVIEKIKKEFGIIETFTR